MSNLEKALIILKGCANRHDCPPVNAAMQLLVTLGFIVVVVSVPLLDPGRLVWFFCFPIIMAEALHIGYGKVFGRSLWLLPLIVFIGIFSPLLEHTPCWEIAGITVSCGWVSFISVTLRGLLSVQALIILISSCDFNDICRSMSRFGIPGILVAQLQMLYRFLTVLLEEALSMHRARQSRGFGRKNYPLNMWGTFAGQLLVRSIDRASRINRAMLARGYRGGSLPGASQCPLRANDWIYLLVWAIIIAILRIFDLSELFGNLLQ